MKSFQQYLKEKMKAPEYKKHYDALEPEFAIKDQLKFFGLLSRQTLALFVAVVVTAIVVGGGTWWLYDKTIEGENNAQSISNNKNENYQGEITQLKEDLKNKEQELYLAKRSYDEVGNGYIEYGGAIISYKANDDSDSPSGIYLYKNGERKLLLETVLHNKAGMLLAGNFIYHVPLFKPLPKLDVVELLYGPETGSGYIKDYFVNPKTEDVISIQPINNGMEIKSTNGRFVSITYDIDGSCPEIKGDDILKLTPGDILSGGNVILKDLLLNGDKTSGSSPKKLSCVYQGDEQGIQLSPKPHLSFKPIDDSLDIFEVAFEGIAPPITSWGENYRLDLKLKTLSHFD